MTTKTAMKSQAIVVTGAGGVGKTTVAAGLAVKAASEGKRTLVLTVDPAKRLAGALGLELGGEPRQHPEQPLLWGAMLDAAASWQTLARRHADPMVADRLVNNEFFQAATVHFPASQSYAAAEEAANYLDARVWDLVVIDTPPAAGGIDFFTAPAQMSDLVGGRLLRLLTGGRIPGRNFFFNRGARPMLRFADQLLGSDLLERVAQFLMDLRTTYDGVAGRSREIDSHLRKAKTVVVTTADPGSLDRSHPLLPRTPRGGCSPGGGDIQSLATRPVDRDSARGHRERGSDQSRTGRQSDTVGLGISASARCPRRIRSPLQSSPGDGSVAGRRSQRPRQPPCPAAANRGVAGPLVR